MTSFVELGLIEPICLAVAAEGYEDATPIQEQAIPHVLARLGEIPDCPYYSLHIGTNDNNLTRAGKAMKLVSFFAPDGQITFDATGYPARTLSGRDEIKEAVLAGFTGLTQLKVQFLDATVRFGADRQTADVSCTARVDAGDSKDYDVQEIRFQLKKVDGDWLITLAATVKTLS